MSARGDVAVPRPEHLKRRLAEQLERVVEVARTDVLARDAKRPVRPHRGRVEVHVERCTADRSEECERLLPVARRRDAQTFFARGDVGYVATVDGRFAGCIWVSRTTHRDGWSGLRIRLAADEAYAYALWVEPDDRPKGVGVALCSALLQDLYDDPGVTRVYGWVDKGNRESQLLLRMLGYAQVQQVTRVRLFDRIGLQLPRSDEPHFGPCSTAGRHRGDAEVPSP